MLQKHVGLEHPLMGRSLERAISEHKRCHEKPVFAVLEVLVVLEVLSGSSSFRHPPCSREGGDMPRRSISKSFASRALKHGYPRPLLQREAWESLNGPWEFAIDPDQRWDTPGEVTWK